MKLRNALKLMAVVALFAGTSAFAQDEAVAGGLKDAYSSLGAALALGIAAFGGAIGQSRAASAALEGIARNPSAGDKLFTPMIIALALIESLVLYTFVIAFLKI